ncbi:MAG: hypothetical protein FWF45_04255 [Coriobacteriia bacterium]|nr:hypothetical protein [Coriobacteriia bacterium]
MAWHPIEAFRNPVTRPRAIIWAGVVLVVLLVFVTVAIAATSSYWFCAEGCHKVQDDAVAAYDRGTHNQVSCLACHLPANANPIIFLYHKVHSAIGELPLTFANTFEVPLNPLSKVSLSSEEFPDTQCTQCHDMQTRPVTSSSGIIFDHSTHSEMKIRCTFCHNRVGHNEDGLALKGVQPKTGEKAYQHPNYLTMDGCFRCHSLDKDAVASGQCNVCHTQTDIATLKPSDHTANFQQTHGKLFIEQVMKVNETEKETGQQAPTPASVQKDLDNLAAGKGTGSAASDNFAWPVAPIGTVNTCYTCHTKADCEACHVQKGIHYQL